MLQVHHLFGRLRVSSSLLKKNPLLAEKIRNDLWRLLGVSKVACNSVTGSVLVHFSPGVVSPRLIMQTITRYLRAGNVIAFPAVTRIKKAPLCEGVAPELAATFGNVLLRSIAEQLAGRVGKGVALRMVKTLLFMDLDHLYRIR
jgi:hypothetical protein